MPSAIGELEFDSTLVFDIGNVNIPIYVSSFIDALLLPTFIQATALVEIRTSLDTSSIKTILIKTHAGNF